MIALYVSLGAVLIIILLILIRAFLFRPNTDTVATDDGVSFSSDIAAKTLSEMIKCRTVSNIDPALEDEAEFSRFESLLKSLFPTVYEKCSVIDVHRRAILIKWQGKSADLPTVLMAHYDVVFADNNGWKHHPFSGNISDGCVWGRGSIDTKITLNAILCAAEELIKQNFTPARDIYMAFGGNEEIGGNGAPSIVDWFIENNVTPGIVLDEGGAVVDKVFPGVNSPCALIGIAEKGMLNVRYSVSGIGGHSSAPSPESPVGILSRACRRVEKRPFKLRFTPPARRMLDTVARHSSFGYRLIFANLWLFTPIINLITRKNGGELGALLRTTVAFTQMRGSEGMNVIPPYAEMVSNHRIIPGETFTSVVSRIKKTVADERVKIDVIYGMDPSRISKTDGEGWERLTRVAKNTWDGAVVSPYLMLACSDSRHWGKISDAVYRFSPLYLTAEERASIHAHNERIPTDKVVTAVEFYTRFILES
ncbi:MAG: M20/M25/M40 family metallo-hydrolase [Clostridia bacterium]|nr:M20/M25/M40 family metallo-hydrolase [Clostridia bacterium]